MTIKISSVKIYAARGRSIKKKGAYSVHTEIWESTLIDSAIFIPFLISVRNIEKQVCRRVLEQRTLLAFVFQSERILIMCLRTEVVSHFACIEQRHRIDAYKIYTIEDRRMK